MSAEQFANLAQSTVGTAYSPGDLVLHLASAASFPAAGPFSVTVVDKNTALPKLVFRVSSVSGNALTGAAETADVACSVNDQVYGTILSAAAMANIIAEASASAFIQPLVAPDHTVFSPQNFNDGSHNITTEIDNSSPVTSITLQGTQGGGFCISYIEKAVLASKSFTVTVAIATGGDVDNGGGYGLILSDGTKIIFFYVRNTGTGSAPLLNIQQWNSYTSHNSDPYMTEFYYAGPLLWLRVTEDAVHRSYFTSSDGITFSLIYQEAVTTFFTSTEYGFGGGTSASATGGQAQGTLYSFKETNP